MVLETKKRARDFPICRPYGTNKRKEEKNLFSAAPGQIMKKAIFGNISEKYMKMALEPRRGPNRK